MTTDPNPGGAPERPLRELMLNAGLEVLERDGLGLGTPSLSYTKVFAHLEREHGVRVTRASVHERIWASHDDFRRDVVARALDHLPTNPFGSRSDELRAAVVDMYERGLTADERAAEFSRLFAALGFKTLLTMPAILDVQMAKAMAAPFNDPLAADVLQGSIRERVDVILAQLSQRLAAVTSGLGFMPDPALGLSHGAAHELCGVMVTNMLVGAILEVHSGSGELVEPLAFRGRPATADEPWTMLGIGLHALLNVLFVESDGTTRLVPDPPSDGEEGERPRIETGDGSARRRREDLRELVLAAGVEVLLQQRMNLRPESLGYASVFTHLENKHGVTLTRSSVHNRIWASHDDYWLDVLTHAIRNDPLGDISLVAVAQPDVDETTNARLVVMNTARVESAAGIAQSLCSPNFLRRQAIKAALIAEPDSEPINSLRRAIHETQLEILAHYSRGVRDNLTAQGFAVRPELGIDVDEAARIVATLAGCTAIGAVFDQSAGIEATARSFPLRRPHDGGTDDWTAPGLATWALVDLLFQQS